MDKDEDEDFSARKGENHQEADSRMRNLAMTKREQN